MKLSDEDRIVQDFITADIDIYRCIELLEHIGANAGTDHILDIGYNATDLLILYDENKVILSYVFDHPDEPTLTMSLSEFEDVLRRARKYLEDDSHIGRTRFYGRSE